MEEADYRMRTGAWVALLLAIAVMISSLYLGIAGINLLQFDLSLKTKISLILISLIPVGCYSHILKKNKNPKSLALLAIIAASVVGAITLIGLFFFSLAQHTDFGFQRAMHIVLVAFIITSGLSWMLAVVGVLQLDEIKDRGIGCLLIVSAAIVSIVTIFMLN